MAVLFPVGAAPVFEDSSLGEGEWPAVEAALAGDSPRMDLFEVGGASSPKRGRGFAVGLAEGGTVEGGLAGAAGTPSLCEEAASGSLGGLTGFDEGAGFVVGRVGVVVGVPAEAGPAPEGVAEAVPEMWEIEAP